MSPVPVLALGKGSQARKTTPSPAVSPGKEQVKCKGNPVSKKYTNDFVKYTAAGCQGAGGWLVGYSGTLESVGQHSIETTEINRSGEWTGVLDVPWASATRETQTGPHPLTCPSLLHPTPRAPLVRLPNAVALTQSTQLADWLKGKDYNVGWAEWGWAEWRWAGKLQSARAGASLSTRPGLPVGVLQSHHPQGVQIPPPWHRECQ